MLNYRIIHNVSGMPFCVPRYDEASILIINPVGAQLRENFGH